MNRPATAPHDTAAARKKLIIALDFERRREAEASLASAQAAKFAAGARRLPLLGVTVLTSYNDKDLAEAGYAYGVADLVARHAAQARACAHEVCAMRARCAGYTAGGSGSWRPKKNHDAGRTSGPARAIMVRSSANLEFSLRPPGIIDKARINRGHPS
jgi:orotidine-5'-phosphate decarboxylase